MEYVLHKPSTITNSKPLKVDDNYDTCKAEDHFRYRNGATIGWAMDGSVPEGIM